MPKLLDDVWAGGSAYEPYMGRWSRLVAQACLSWLSVPAGSHWLDVGCGTGALSRTILQVSAPASVTGIDHSIEYVSFARAHVQDGRAHFYVGDAQALPLDSEAYDAVISGLVLNFVPWPHQAVAEMTRVARAGGVVAVYVWDYAGRMQMLRHFWNAAAALDPAAHDRDEGRRFPLCRPQALEQLFVRGGLKDVTVRPVDVVTDFRDFADYWSPFLGGQGPAPSYVMSLTEEQRAALRERIRAGLPFAVDGSIPLVARAWAVRGRRP